MDNSSKDLINHYQLEKHPEGGWYKETYRSEDILFNDNQEKRNLATSIYFLLNHDEKSNFHMIKSDELWFHHQGESLIIHCISPNGTYSKIKLGQNIKAGEKQQALVTKGTIFGSTIESNSGFALVGCVVAPGFDFTDFKLFKTEELLALYPKQKSIILTLT